MRSNSEDQFIGMFDMIDVVHFIAENFEEATIMGPGFEGELQQAEKFLHARVKDVVDFSRRNPFVPVPDDASMFTIGELLADLSVHRVNVFNSEGKLANIITQSAMVELLEKNLDRMPDKAAKTVGSIGKRPVITVDISEPTINAFRVLYKHGLYAVPVVNKLNGNSIVANISAKDVKIVCSTPAHLSLLHSPISQFLSAVHQQEIDICTPSITVQPGDTLKKAIRTIIANRIHRVYVINPDNSIASVLSLTDILHQFVTDDKPACCTGGKCACCNDGGKCPCSGDQPACCVEKGCCQDAAKAACCPEKDCCKEAAKPACCTGGGASKPACCEERKDCCYTDA